MTVTGKIRKVEMREAAVQILQDGRCGTQAAAGGRVRTGRPAGPGGVLGSPR